MVKIGYKVLLAADVWTYTPRTLTEIKGTPRSDLVGADEPIYTRLDANVSTRSSHSALDVWHMPKASIVTSGTIGLHLKETVEKRSAITPVTGTIGVPAATWTSVDIQPPAGEIWDVIVTMFHGIAGQWYYTAAGILCYFDGTSEYWKLYRSIASGSYGDATTFLSDRMYLTNTKYLRIKHYAGGGAVTGYRQYWGFKLGASKIPSHTLKNPSELPVWKRDKVIAFEPLRPYGCEIFDGLRYREAIMLEEDTPLLIDEKGNIIERLTVYAFLDDFEALFKDIITDTTKRPMMTYMRADSVKRKLGWEKYLDKWKVEGIEF